MKKNEIISLTKAHTVIHHNDLSEIPTAGFTAAEKNIFYTQVYMAHNMGEQISYLSPLEIRKLIGYKSTDAKRFKKILDSYTDKVMDMKMVNKYSNNNNEITHKTNLVSDVIYDDEGRIATLFNPTFSYIFNSLVNNNMFSLEDFCSIPSIHSKECYHALMRFKDTGFWDTDIDTFKRKCEIPAKTVGSKIKPIVEKIIDELNPYFDNLSYEFKKGGYRNTQIIGIRFTFKPIKKKLNKPAASEEENPNSNGQDAPSLEYICPLCGEELVPGIVDKKEKLIHKNKRAKCKKAYTFPEYMRAKISKSETDDKKTKHTCPICGDPLTEKVINGSIAWCHPENFKKDGRCQKIWNAISDIREYERNYKEKEDTTYSEDTEMLNKTLKGIF